MNRKQKEAMIAYGLKIAGLEEIVRRHKICIDAHNTRLSDHDESIAALDETAVQLSPCKCQAGELLKRIEKLELEVVRADTFRQNHIDRIVKLEKVKEDVRDLWCSQKAVVDEAIRRDVAVETLQQQVKEINARLTYLLDTMVEMNKVLKVKPKRTTRVVSDTAPVSTKNMLAKPSGRPRKVTADKEYKRIKKHGVSVG